MTLEVIVLAAGQGTRMRSDRPKVLHPIAGKPMLGHVLDTVKRLDPRRVHVVVGHGAEQVTAHFADSPVNWVQQTEQLGTGHAVAQAMPEVADDAVILIAYGDVPLVQPETLKSLANSVDDNTLTLLTVKLDNPTGYGRIVRNEAGAISEIVEQKDATDAQLAIDEVNTGILAVQANKLHRWLPQLSADNAQGEYYLTDIIAMAVAQGMQVSAQHPQAAWEVQGVNNRQQQSELERIYQRRQADHLMTEGATLADPQRLDVRGDISVGRDVFIDVNCVFVGRVVLADGVTIGPNCTIQDSCIGEGTQILPNSVLEQATTGKHCNIGPFARLRPGTTLADDCRIGNFVETKNAAIGEGSKVNHLSYIGDCEIGSAVNIGAGTITCNYDGVNKHRTVIGDGTFIGSNTALVAPVTIGKNATVGAGSTITDPVESEQLSIARSRQRNIDNWQHPQKRK